MAQEEHKVKFSAIDPEEEEDRTNRGYEHSKNLAVRIFNFLLCI